MPLANGDIEASEAQQRLAAHDEHTAVRLVAGPGTGKSASIVERFRWLYADQGVQPRHVYGVSFTRAASKDLRIRVARACEQIPVAADEIQISTLHSLALHILARAHMLNAYPVRPLVLDDWEVEHIFDAEFAATTGWTPSRCEEIRRAHEAFWSTGVWDPANYIQPDPPVSDEERNRFAAFRTPTTQTYACVLPGEIVRLCVDRIEAGLLPAAELMGMRHLIVDEYQDLNPMDIRLIDQLRAQGVSIFAAGDDDQSIYAFRFASPGGIEDFPARHVGAGDHVLAGCFRCATGLVAASQHLIHEFSSNNRIAKELVSLWTTAQPAVAGTVYRWRFNQYAAEAKAIAASCQQLIADGVRPAQIMVLLSNKLLFSKIRKELEALIVPFIPPREDSWQDTEAGRFMFGLLRAIGAADDYVALRLILGCRRGTGAKSCAQIVERSVANNLGYDDLFHEPLPGNVFAGRHTTALNHARDACVAVADFADDDRLDERAAVVRALLVDARGENEATDWDALVAEMPPGTTLSDVRDYLAADNSEQQHTLLVSLHKRLHLEPPVEVPGSGVRVMTMHGAKGLQADVVFVPGLEEEILPGPKRAGVAGLVLEGARLLYVSITRARAAAIVSLAYGRYWYGGMSYHHPSRYSAQIGGPFDARTDGLSAAESAQIAATIVTMNPQPPLV